MGLLQYPNGTFWGDCVRGLAGLALVALLFVLGPLGIFLNLVLASLAGLFLLFICRAWFRARCVYDFNDERLTRTFDGRHIRWSNLSDLSLAYYTTRQDGQAGWLELKLVAATGVIKVDSRLTGFNTLLQRALRAARDNHLQLSPVTCNNAGSFGEFPASAGFGAQSRMTSG